MSDIERDWPDHKPEETYLHPGIIEERVKHPEEIRQDKKTWDYYQANKPREPDVGLRISIGCLVLFFMVAFILGLLKLIA